MQCDSIFYCLDLGLLLRSRRNKAQMKAASETKPPSSISHSSLPLPTQTPSTLPAASVNCPAPSLMIRLRVFHLLSLSVSRSLRSLFTATPKLSPPSSIPIHEAYAFFCHYHQNHFLYSRLCTFDPDPGLLGRFEYFIQTLSSLSAIPVIFLHTSQFHLHPSLKSLTPSTLHLFFDSNLIFRNHPPHTLKPSRTAEDENFTAGAVSSRIWQTA